MTKQFIGSVDEMDFQQSAPALNPPVILKTNNIARSSKMTSATEILRVRFYSLRPRDWSRIGHRPGPYRHLRMSRRWLPHRRLRTQTAKRKHNTKTKDQRLHHNPYCFRSTPSVLPSAPAESYREPPECTISRPQMFIRLVLRWMSQISRIRVELSHFPACATNVRLG